MPQIADFFTLISTSFGPTSGTGTRSIQSPTSGFVLTSAFIIFVIWLSPKSTARYGGAHPVRRARVALAPRIAMAAPHPAAATFSPRDGEKEHAEG
ncbi:hypothetical protein ASD52_33820 [Ensifer sp. Root142]|nr:hypothetical protein ASD52_33820 [Ensifer sp. Root142]